MFRFGFSAQELLAMAYASRKSKMYGIPDGFAGLEKAERHLAIQAICDQLAKDNIMQINADGEYKLDPQYHTLLSWICECSQCLTINIQKGPGKTEVRIFWRKNNSMMQAEMIGSRYFFSEADPIRLTDCCKNVLCGESDCVKDPIEVPQIALYRAKRFCTEGKIDEAARILLQNGANKTEATVIRQGLEGKAHYIGVLLINNQQGECQMKEKAFLSNGNVVLELSQDVSNFRTCAKFTPVLIEQAEASLGALVQEFIRD